MTQPNKGHSIENCPVCNHYICKCPVEEFATQPNCPCACHENKLNKPYEHDTKCCDKMNGVVTQHKWEKCERADVVLLSKPCQYQCKKCGNTWFEGTQTPVCGQFNSDDLEEIIREVQSGRIDSVHIHNFIQKSIQQAREEVAKEINKQWLALNLRNDNKENWSKELDKFGLFMQGISLTPNTEIQ